MARLGSEWREITWTEKGYGLTEALRAAGIQVAHRDGRHYATDPDAANAFIAAHDAAAWEAKKAADAVASNRTSAAARADDAHDPVATEYRALISTLNKRINWLTARVIELQEDLQAAKATSGGADSIRDAIRGRYLATSTRSGTEALVDFKDDIAKGEGDPR